MKYGLLGDVNFKGNPNIFLCIWRSYFEINKPELKLISSSEYNGFKMNSTEW